MRVAQLRQAAVPGCSSGLRVGCVPGAGKARKLALYPAAAPGSNRLAFWLGVAGRGLAVLWVCFSFLVVHVVHGLVFLLFCFGHLCVLLFMLLLWCMLVVYVVFY